MTSRRISLLAGVVLVVAACSGGGATPKPPTAAPPTAPPPTAAAPTTAATNPPASAGANPTVAPYTGETVCDNLPEDVAGDQLEAICNAGVLKVSTDPNYAPQSFLNPDGTFEGFDIDTA